MTTDANGNYLFSNLVPATYSVKFTAPSGYVFTKRNVAACGGDKDSDADPATVRSVLVQPAMEIARSEKATVDLEAFVRLGLDGLQGLVEPLTQHPELQRVEQGVHGFAIPLPEVQVVRADRERHIATSEELSEVGKVAAIGLDGVAGRAALGAEHGEKGFDVRCRFDHSRLGLIAVAN